MVENLHCNTAGECGFGLTGYCCNLCAAGPCRITPFDQPVSLGKCGFSQEQRLIAQFLIHLMVEWASIPAGVVSVRDEYLGRALSWIASGPCAVIEEGARMILDFALAVIHLRAGDAGAAPALCEGSPVDKKAYLVDEGQCPEEEKIIAGMAGVGIQLIPVSSGDLISIPEGQRASNTVLVRGVRSGRISALFGLAAGGFDVCASLPLGLLACHDLRGVFERLLTDCYGGRLTDFSEFAPTGRK